MRPDSKGFLAFNINFLISVNKMTLTSPLRRGEMNHDVTIVPGML